jgi:hypothetical protein
MLGWMGFDVPPIPKHRNKTRAGFRKTSRRRGDSLIEDRARRPRALSSPPGQLTLV